jgi:hypothetical protein
MRVKNNGKWRMGNGKGRKAVKSLFDFPVGVPG